MLLERAFFIGAALCAAAGVLLIGALAIFGALSIDPLLAFPGLLFLLFAGVFFYVSGEARRDRRALLRVGEEGTVGRPPDPPASR